MIIDEILDEGKDTFYQEKQEIIQKRFKAISETTRYQFENCNVYRQFCKQKSFNPRRDLKSYEDVQHIPYLTSANFKRESGRPKELLCVPEDEIYVWTLSSGTSGDPSIIGRDKLNIQRFFKMFDIIIEELANIREYNWSLFFQPPPKKRLTIEDKVPEPVHHMGYIFNVENKLPMDKRVYALKPAGEEAKKQGKRFEFAPEKTFRFLNDNPSEKGNGWVAGSIPLIYQSLTNYHQKTGQTFNIGEDSFMLSGGGWKTYSGEAVSPEKFREDMCHILGIPKPHITDTYSFTETDCAFSECEYHNKHSLPWQDVIVRDVETLEPVGIGEEGLINVINPLAHSYAGVSVLQDDIVKITMEDECPCGRKGKIVEVVGRAEGVEARGCGAQIVDDTYSE
ncbi:MAG: hypothetical protein R6U96_18955 [Promethearchaeia archaeon]